MTIEISNITAASPVQAGRIIERHQPRKQVASQASAKVQSSTAKADNPLSDLKKMGDAAGSVHMIRMEKTQTVSRTRTRKAIATYSAPANNSHILRPRIKRPTFIF